MADTSIWPSVVGGVVGSFADTGLSMLTGRSNMQAQADLQFANWKKQFDAINEYNRPANQLKRWSEVGVNPFVNPGSAMSVGKSSSDASPSAGLPAFAPAAGFGNSFSQLMQGLLSAQQAKGKGIENEKLSDFLSAQIRNQLSQAGHAEVLQELDQLKVDFEREFGRSKYKSSIFKELSSALESYSKALLNRDYEPARISSETWRNNIEGLLSQAKKRLTDLEYQDLETRLYYLDDMLQGDLEVKQSESNRNRAEAYKAREEGRTQESVRRLNAMNAFKSEAEGNKFYAEYERLQHTEKAFVDKLISEASIEHKKDRVFSWQFGIELAKAVAMGAMTVTGAGKLWRLLRGATSAQAAANIASKNKKSVGDIMEHVGTTSEQGSGVPVFPRDKDLYPNLYRIWQSGRSGVR